MKILFQIIAILFIYNIISSCSKHDELSEVSIEIIAPNKGDAIQLPDNVQVELIATSNKPIEYIRISIDNKNLTPLSDRIFIYPTGSNYSGTVDLFLETLPEIVRVPPYLIHIAINDFSEVHHFYQEINLVMEEVRFKGLLSCEERSVVGLTINLYNDQNNLLNSLQIDGNFLASTADNNSNYFLSTNTPELVRGIDMQEGEIIWQKDPQLPYPETSHMYIDGSSLYLSTAIGRIVGVRANDGSQFFTTLVKPDTIPNHLTATEKFLFASCSMRKSNNLIWTSYYKETGSNYYQYPTEFETVSLFPDGNDKAIIFCNKDDIGNIVLFDIESNQIESSFQLNDIKINKVDRVDPFRYFISNNNSVFLFDLTDNSIHVVYESSDSIVDLKYEKINQKIYISTSLKIDIISFSNFIPVGSISSSNKLVAIELIYGY